MNDQSRSHADGPTATSTSLIVRIQQSDAAARDTFARLYLPLIYSWCRRAGLQPADADDVGQEAFQTALTKIGKYQRTGQFRGWLWTITRNKITDYRRRRKRAPNAVGGTDFNQRLAELPEAPPEDDSGEASSGDPVLRRALEMIREEFEESTWVAFWRMVVEGHPAAEIAKELGWNGPTKQDTARGTKRVRQAKLRVMKRLRDEFAEVLDLP
jgi:RNA polymerase sigma-70 factor (ECF subfamily)